MIGKIISHYKILEKLGQGGMGVLYKARDTQLDRFVAMKFLPPHLGQNAEKKQRFIYEAKAASSLDHPNICTIHEIGETEDGQMYIAMAFYEGEPLKDKIERGPLPLDQTIDIAMQVAQGLARAHDADIVHRDIKPANIMITERGEIKIVDFGVAKAAGLTELTQEGTTLGTISYMSPEQTQGIEVDQRTDIWSLGMVLYEMITGQAPFKRDFEPAVMYLILNVETEPITALRTGVPLELEHIVNKALTKMPEERYQHVGEMLTDLHRLRKQLNISGEVQPIKNVQKKTGNKRLKLMVVSTGILFIFAVAFFLIRSSLFDEVSISAPKPIAVISFENMTGDSSYDYLQRVIPNLFITSLEQSPYLRVATWERLRDLSKQAGREDVDIIDKELGFELCRLAGINRIVVGSFARAGEVFVTDVKVLDVESKSILESASATGEGVGSILATQIDEITKEISRDLGIAQGEVAETQRPVAAVTTTSLEAYDNFILGRDAFRKSYHSEVIRYMDQAVALDSTFAMAHLYLSFYQHLPRAARHRQLAKRFSHTATRKDQLYIEIVAADSPEKQLSLRQQYVRKYPKEKRAHLELGGLYLGRDRHKESLEETQKALELDPEYGLALNQLGFTYAAMGHFEKSIQAMKKYISVDPGNANAFDSLAEIYLKMGKMDEAIENFKQAIALKPDYWADWRIAYCYALKEDYEQALEWNMSMIKKVQARSSLFGLSALYHYFSGSRKQAFLDLTNWEKVRYGRVERIKCWIYYDQSKLESARTASRIYSRRYIERRQPGSWFKVYNNACLGLVSVKEGKLNSAAHYLNNAASSLLESSPDKYTEYKDFYYHLLYAELLVSQDSLAKAITIAKRISVRKIPKLETVNIIPYNFPFVIDVLARAYKKQGDLDKAIAEYERLTKINPLSKDRRLINPIYHFRLAKLYDEKGIPAKAIERYKKFLDIWKNADEDLPELIDAKARLARLKKFQRRGKSMNQKLMQKPRANTQVRPYQI